MRLGIGKRDLVSLVLVCISAVLLIFAIVLQRSPSDTESVSRRVERIVSMRMARLERYVLKEPSRLPSDMVIYRYEGDSLKKWSNQFPLNNDDIHPAVMIQRLSNPRARLRAPLSDVTDSVGFLNFGDGWYLAKAIFHDKVNTTIIGLEISNTAKNRSYNGTNPKLYIGDRFSIKPLEYSGGSMVSVDRKPQFKIMYDSLEGRTTADPLLVWLSFAFFLAGIILFVVRERTLQRFCMSAAGMAVSIAAMYAWGRSAQIVLPFFSPILFAGGSVLFSLGAVVLVNLAIFLLVGGLYLVRKDILVKIRSVSGYILGGVSVLVAIIGICIYTHLTLRSIIINSGICLELYKFEMLSKWSGIVYLSFLGMLTAVPMLLQLLQPALVRLTGRHFHPMSNIGRTVFALIVSSYMVAMAGLTGIDRERDRQAVWANRLVVDRDIALELQLKRVESRIAGDVLIAPLVVLDNASTIRNRIIENYFPRLSQQDYDVKVFLVSDYPDQPDRVRFMDERVAEGIPIADGSHFLYTDTGYGYSRYDGLFVYYVEGAGLMRMMLEVSAKSADTGRGYSRLTNITPPGKVHLPSFYSYARYVDGKLRIYRGAYAYPTYLGPKETSQWKSDGYIHDSYQVTDDEVVVISRPRVDAVGYAIAFVAVAFLAYALLEIITAGRRRKRSVFVKSYYKPRIVLILMTSLALTLVVMATVSVVYVYRSNEVNLRTIISDNVTNIQTMVQDRLRAESDFGSIPPQELASILEEVGACTSSDITLFNTSGRFIISTSPEIYSSVVSGCRANPQAFNQVVREHRRYYIVKESIGRRRYYSMYAPLYSKEGILLAVMCSPYTGGESFDYERDAIMHSMTVLMVFLLMLMISRFYTNAVVDKMFQPLSMMSRKMSNAGLDTLEHIEYDRDDEISSLVQAYNRMVDELSENSRKLAQAERDKAWSGMARQVAHEIKNPLTPMKLQLQRIIRLKQKGDPTWQEKFDDMSKVLLDHIDILTETANEFSTFAKLYTEDPTLINLDQMLQEEIAMFDSREDVRFEYIGLRDAFVTGPKPQLVRVFVNLMGNAVQALDDRPDGRIVVALRKSHEDGYYDIAVEDNGPGVDPDNVQRLFSPNFTTKSSGSGLGLAISRSILEKCGATISYSRSFVLGGACFTVKYPVHAE